jgi:hypothetical protein
MLSTRAGPVDMLDNVLCMLQLSSTKYRAVFPCETHDDSAEARELHKIS